MRRPLSVLAVAATTALLPGHAAPPAQEGPPPTPVRAVRAEVRSVVQRESVSGSLRTASDARLAARENGAVESFEVREGDVVKRGDVLAQLDARRLQANRAMTVAMAAEAEATRIRWDAEVEDAELDAAALEKARGGDAISERELRQARTRLKVSRANAQAAVKREEALAAELLLLDIRVNDMTIRAPFDGVVVERHVEVGEWVVPGDAVVTLLSVSKLEVWLDVPQRLAERIDSSRTSMLISAGADRLQVVATEPKVVPRIDPKSRMFSLVARIEGESARGLSPGMSASAYLPVGKEQETLMLPKDALVYRPGGTGVMVVMGQDEGGASVNGVAALMPVTVMFETDRDVAIAPGAVRPGAAVIVEGNERLFPGTPVAASIDAKSPQPID
ncbi:MAG: efflux RND transporter periplasmic adaptor subunit [Planctomycetota bacterium]